jgi:hypothetical protein
LLYFAGSYGLVVSEQHLNYFNDSIVIHIIAVAISMEYILENFIGILATKTDFTVVYSSYNILIIRTVKAV